MPSYITLGSRILKRGDEGTDVELLQNLLKILPDPIGSAIKEKGVFGAETEAAVKKFQKYFNLTVDGIVGNKTFLFLGVPTGPYIPPGGNLFGARTLKTGSYGYDVWVLQNRLATTAKKFAETMGQPATKYFDAKTEEAVKMFQKDVHLEDDGIVGPQTFYQIYNYAGMGGRILQKGRWDRNQGYDVYWLQRNLQELGFYNGKLDAMFGPLTEAAVKKLQETAGIKADGIVGAETFYHLATI
ncbi:MAG: peptidoglycan-binding protein [Syntrophomonas sp.]